MAKPQPMQPIYLEGQQPRFQPNAIIRWLLDSGKVDILEVMALPVPIEDKAQFHQMMGYSVDGFAEVYGQTAPGIVGHCDRQAGYVQRGVDPCEGGECVADHVCLKHSTQARVTKSSWTDPGHSCGQWRDVTDVHHSFSQESFSSKVKLSCGHEVLYKHCTSPLVVGHIKVGDEVKCHGLGCCSTCCPTFVGACSCESNGCQETVCNGRCGCAKCHLSYSDFLSSRSE
jgi:hypothetical protein